MNKYLIVLVSLFVLYSCADIFQEFDIEKYVYYTERDVSLPYIERRPEGGLLPWNGKVLNSLPKPSNYEIDLRSYDLSKLDLSNNYNELMVSSFSDNTVWPNNLPKNFDPQEIIEIGKNPGLNIKKVHNLGVTGKGIGIGIIDQVLLVDHNEYKDNIVYYEEINQRDMAEADMHGAAVVSLAVGKNCGVAPDSDIYYIAAESGYYTRDGFKFDYTFIAYAIDRLLYINTKLPKENKIRVISIQNGWTSEKAGYDKVMAACKRAKDAGVFILSSSNKDVHDNQFNFFGLGRKPLAAPDSFESYEKTFWGGYNYYDVNNILVPMNSRSMASQEGIGKYSFSRDGGLSWSIPYIAGLYALACQVKPDITPEIFWDKALETGVEVDFSTGKIVDSLALIEELSR